MKTEKRKKAESKRKLFNTINEKKACIRQTKKTMNSQKLNKYMATVVAAAAAFVVVAYYL